MLNQHDYFLHLKTQLCLRVLQTSTKRDTLEWSPHTDKFNSSDPGSPGLQKPLGRKWGSGCPFWVELETSSHIRLPACRGH